MQKQTVTKAKHVANLCFTFLFLTTALVAWFYEPLAIDKAQETIPDESAQAFALVALVHMIGIIIFGFAALCAGVVCFVASMKFKKYYRKNTVGAGGFILDMIDKTAFAVFAYLVGLGTMGGAWIKALHFSACTLALLSAIFDIVFIVLVAKKKL